MTIDEYRVSPFRGRNRNNHILTLPKGAIYICGTKAGYAKGQQQWWYSYVEKITGTKEQPIVHLIKRWDHWIKPATCKIIKDKELIKDLKNGHLPNSGQGRLW